MDTCASTSRAEAAIVPAGEADEALREGRFPGETEGGGGSNALRELLGALCGGHDRAFPEGEREVAAWRGALDERVDRLWEQAEQEDREALRRLLEKVGKQ